MNRALFVFALAATGWCQNLAPTGTLRATFIAGNPVQAKGPAADLTRELGKKLGVPAKATGLANVRAVMDSVKSGAADIGFVAFEEARAAEVDFSQVYSLSWSSYLVMEGSAIRKVADADRKGVRIGGTAGDSPDVFLGKTLREATLRHYAANEDAVRALRAGEIDAYAMNRARAMEAVKTEAGLRVAEDNFFAVPQAIVVAKGNAAGLETVNRFLAEARGSGLLKRIVDSALLPGFEMAPEPAVTLLLLGDINVEQRADPRTAFVNLGPTLRKADLVYGNLEGLLVKSEGPDKDIPDKSGWQHIGPEAVEALKAGNVAVVGVANNVAYGPGNILASLAVLDANHIAHTGAGKDLEEAHQPAIVERGGVRFGFLQYTAKWYDESLQIATATRAGVARVFSKDGKTVDVDDLARLRQDVKKLRPLVDVLIVSSHNRDGLGRVLSTAAPEAGRGAVVTAEALRAPITLGPAFSVAEEYEKELAHAAIDAGADIVYGHGSHVVQGVEVYHGKPVMYCLGNSSTDWIRMRPNKEGLVARVVVRDRKVERVTLTPLTRDGENNATALDAGAGDGAKLIEKVKGLLPGVELRAEAGEAVLVGK